ncbi:hypothetical protein FH608_046020 [Nonomuraea phyllanthi]|uniref:Phage tail protein n=1 Tax=Nonomuraea phyllanthi TaxID=2219224 RepID=A0A5C4V5S6_9ACTN|nr:phage tail domain-containing protein [Nonomuraea phyllanthi]KAB8186853.1 hypothetical protein FH608_046020 [Nonomuraea phyllanthi]
MARLGRSQPIPVTNVGRLTYWQAATDLPSFSLGWEFPSLQVVSPSVTIPLGSFALGWEFPRVSLPVGLPAFSLEWEFPAIVAVVPTNPGDNLTGADGQIEWNGTVWGPGTPFTVQEITGWRSLPQLDNLNVQRPSRHGAWPARRLAQQRVVTIRLQPNSIGNETEIDDLLSQLDQVTGVLEDETEWPLVIKGFGDAQLAFGAIVDRDVAMDDLYSVGAPTVSVMIVCADPRRYSLSRSGVDLLLDEEIVVSNAGNVATHPIVRIPGPVVDPTLTNLTLDRVLQFSITLDDSEQMVIDTDVGTVTVGSDSQMRTLTGVSVPVTEWVLARGTNTLKYSANSGGDSPAVCLYRDSWL